MYGIGEIHTQDASYHAVDGMRQGDYFSFAFRDNHRVGSILMGDATLSSSVKRVIQKQLDCSRLLRHHLGVEQVLHLLREAPLSQQ